MRRIFDKAIILAALLWLGFLAAGFTALMEYDNKPAKTLTPVSQWPRKSRIEAANQKPTLLMFLHPHCPCSRASLHELIEAIRLSKTQAQVYLIFYQPSTLAADWHKSELWKSAKRQLPNASIIVDIDGQEALNFGSGISGQTIMYSSQQQLLFNGGITAARGQEGDSNGKTKLIQLLVGQSNSLAKSSVYGCPIVAKLAEN